jgi:hypothetical protein
MEYIQYILEWTEKHAGLGGWVGAIGAVVAIFLTWVLARFEYLKTQRETAKAERREKSIITGIVAEFDKLLTEYVDGAFRNDAEAIGFYQKHSSDTRIVAMTDLANLPVMAWPSLGLYHSFKRYWFASLEVLETSNFSPINVEDLKRKLLEREKWILVVAMDLSWPASLRAKVLR